MSHTAQSLNSQLEYIQMQLTDLRNSIITDPTLTDADRDQLLAMVTRSRSAATHLLRQIFVHAQIAQVAKNLANLDITEKSDKDESPETPAKQQQGLPQGLADILRAVSALDPNRKIDESQQEATKQVIDIEATLPQLLNDNVGIKVNNITLYGFKDLISQILLYNNSEDSVLVKVDLEAAALIFENFSKISRLGSFDTFKRSVESAIEDRIKERAKELGINFRDLPSSCFIDFSE